MSDTSTVDEPERKTKMEEFYFQRRILFGCTICLFLGTVLWIVAISTNRWFIVSGGPGIWRNCRYALVPQPVASSVIRDLTTLAIPLSDLQKLKSQMQKEEFVKNFLTVDIPDLETIETIDESFRQHLFTQWLWNNENKGNFGELRSKLHKLIDKPQFKGKETLDPTNYAQVSGSIGDLITKVEVNKTHAITVVVPQMLRQALFNEWDEKGYNVIRLLFHFAKSLDIDPSIYWNGRKFTFRPPLPVKKGFNGFVYTDWRRCTYTSLFADVDEEVIKADPSLDRDMLDFSRTAATFAIITVFVMCMGFIFTVYAFLNPRYMYKRLAGGVHFISGLTSATVCRVLHVSVQHAQEYLSYAFPPGADYTYGYGFYFGIVVSFINFFSCIMFMWYSRKKKGNKAATEELGMADEEVQIGR